MIEQPLLQQFANQLGVTLSQQQLDQFDRYAQLLVEWNEKNQFDRNCRAQRDCDQTFCG